MYPPWRACDDLLRTFHGRNFENSDLGPESWMGRVEHIIRQDWGSTPTCHIEWSSSLYLLRGRERSIFRGAFWASDLFGRIDRDHSFRAMTLRWVGAWMVTTSAIKRTIRERLICSERGARWRKRGVHWLNWNFFFENFSLHHQHATTQGRMLVHVRITPAICSCMGLIEVRLVWSERERNVK